MSKERMVQVTKDEYENLIRDQHTVELLTEYIRQDRQSDPMICLLLGIKRPENHPEQTDLKKNCLEEPLPVPAMEEAEEEKQSPPPRSPRRNRAERK